MIESLGHQLILTLTGVSFCLDFIKSEYLSLRQKTGYTEAENEWAHYVHENFAEDFALAMMLNASLDDMSIVPDVVASSNGKLTLSGTWNLQCNS